MSNILIEADFVQLEICVAAFLSQDPVLLKELNDGQDLHENNKGLFKLPSRLEAKKFIFRMLYGGSAYSYANDPEFQHVSKSKHYWQRAIDKFYEKYAGIAKWHEELIKEVIENGCYYGPTARRFTFTGLDSGRIPDTDIKNYIVQGTGADILQLARILVWRRLYHERVSPHSSASVPINPLPLHRVPLVRGDIRVCRKPEKVLPILRTTVHDSLLIETSVETADDTRRSIQEAWRDIPNEFGKRYGVELNVPCRVEIKQGPTWGTLETIYKG